MISIFKHRIIIGIDHGHTGRTASFLGRLGPSPGEHSLYFPEHVLELCVFFRSFHF